MRESEREREQSGNRESEKSAKKEWTKEANAVNRVNWLKKWSHKFGQFERRTKESEDDDEEGEGEENDANATFEITAFVATNSDKQVEMMKRRPRYEFVWAQVAQFSFSFGVQFKSWNEPNRRAEPFESVAASRMMESAQKVQRTAKRRQKYVQIELEIKLKVTI